MDRELAVAELFDFTWSVRAGDWRGGVSRYRHGNGPG